MNTDKKRWDLPKQTHFADWTGAKPNAADNGSSALIFEKPKKRKA